MKNIYCYIPARLDSTRLPAKNLLKINGTPMCVYILNAIKKSNSIEHFWVNTPDAEIIDVCKAENVAYYKRNPGLTNATTTTEDILKDFVNSLNSEFDLKGGDIILANPTNPLVTAEFIDKFVQHFQQSSNDVIASTTKIKHHLIDKGEVINHTGGNNIGTQHLKPINEMNWLLVGIKNDKLRRILDFNEHILDKDIGTIDTPFPQYLDVDTKEDFELVKAFMENRCNSN